jgi:hypothetical protein
MEKKIILFTFVFLFLVGTAFALTETGSYEGSLNVNTGGGKIIITPNQPPLCVENWIINWSSCSSETQTSTCYDRNSCGTFEFMPQNCFKTQSCTTESSSGGGGGGSGVIKLSAPKCNETWTCGNWTSCKNDIQTRVCNDKNKCGTTDVKPITQRNCSSESLGFSIADVEGKNRGALSSITGAVVGALGTAGTIGVLIFLILIVSAAIIVAIVRKNK